MKQLGVSIGILVLAIGIGAAVVFLVDGNDFTSGATKASTRSVIAPEPQIDQGAYREEVQTIIADFAADPTPQKAFEAHALLLGLRVPGEDRDTHLELVLYLDKQINAESVNIQGLRDIVAGQDWLHL